MKEKINADFLSAQKYWERQSEDTRLRNEQGFDVYNFGFQCNKKRVVDYPSLWPYVREIYQMKDVTPTVNMEHINKTYHVRTPTRMRTH